MFPDSTSPIERDQVIRDTRERVARVEVETHRIKANLARLEADNEANWADELATGCGNVRPAAILPVANGGAVAAADNTQRVAGAAPTPTVTVLTDKKTEKKPAAVHEVRDRLGANAHQARRVQPVSRQAKPRRTPSRRRSISRAWWLSLSVHVAVMAVLAPLGYIVVTHDPIPLFASMFDSETHFDPGAVPVEMVASVDNLEVQEAVFDDVPAAAVAEALHQEFEPIEASGGEVTTTAGQLDVMPTDIGTLMAGDGGEESGRGRRPRGDGEMAGEMGSTNFFGTPARANRVVFLVDNSGSMKHGRMETTLMELARSIEALREKQEFYIVFYSDQAYPMLYPNSVMGPLAATRENKQRVYSWLYTVELCRGGAVLKAMEIAESLEPHVVYMLSDGNIGGDVTMQRLTQPGEFEFTIHTLGMGVEKPRDAQNLAAIAQSHGGTFQMVRTLPAAVQSAKQRPIRSNGPGESWGEHLLH